MQHAQLAPAVGEVERDAGVADEVDTRLGEVRLPAEVGGAARPVAERGEIAARRGAVERALLGLEVLGLDERLGKRGAELGLREARVALQPVRDREAHVGRLVGVALAARVLAREPAAAHVVGTFQHRGGDPGGLGFAVHAPNGTAHLRQQPVSTLDPMRIAIGGDHAGFPLKQHLVEVLEKWGHDVRDLGTDSTEAVDYPPFCAAVARSVVRGDAEFGIVLGGSGQGEQISANKVHGARAALCNDLYTARMARQHNDANVLSIGGRIVAPELAEEILQIFLDTPFEGGRHQRRIDEIADIEREEAPR